MEWWQTLGIILGLVLVLFASGMPVAFAFSLVNIICLFLLVGGSEALSILPLSAFDSLVSFVLIPIPLFILMGEVMLRTGMAALALDAIDKWIGRVPGRLSLLAVGGGTLFSTLSGSSMATTALLGTSLVPEMTRRGYSKSLSIGPVLGSGGLAMIIPPSALAVLLGAIANISIAGLLIGGLVPGLLMALLYCLFILARAWSKPALAPVYETRNVSFGEKVKSLAYVLPLGSIVFLVVGLIFVGAATPSEAAALGAVGSVLLAALYRRFDGAAMHAAILGTTRITAMVFLIITGSKAFSQILAFTGASRGLVETVTDLQLPPFVVLLMMQIILLLLGVFMDQISMMMITIPIYMPIIHALGFDPVWFGIIVLINLEVAGTTPPFGLLLFVMKGVVPQASLGDIYRAAVPFILLDLLAMALIIVFPPLVTWLPDLMRR